MKKSIYLEKLDDLTQLMESVPNTFMGMYFKTVNLAILNLRYETIAFDHDLDEHPYGLVARLIDEQTIAFQGAAETLFAEDAAGTEIEKAINVMEEKHKDLFNLLWNRYEGSSLDEYIDRYKYRAQINNLPELIQGKRCLDIGCGNGNFCFALVEMGAAFAVGVDFGEESIAFADIIRKDRAFESQCEFKVATAYKLPYPDDSFDFLIQNGVFHHLDNEDKAIIEACRVLKPGGYFWYYTDGEGGISYALFDRSVQILRDVPSNMVTFVLNSMGLSNNKVVHLSDGMKATYRHTSWNEITTRLESLGFRTVRRLQGGYDTDFDDDVIEADPYGHEKFGEGDLRVLVQKV